MIELKNGKCLRYAFPWDGFGQAIWNAIVATSICFPDTTYIILKTDALTESTLIDLQKEFIYIVPAVYYKCILPPNVRVLYSPSNERYTEQIQFETCQPKINKIVWRGQTACHAETPNVREILCDLLKDDDRCDCKLVNGSWQPPFNPDYRLSINEQIKYKGILVIDGGGFASPISWVLGSGCVPMICSIYYTGLQNYLVPWVHYVPIDTDMSNLLENIDWVLTHDDECKVIANNAMIFYKEKMNHMYMLNMLYKTMDSSI